MTRHSTLKGAVVRHLEVVLPVTHAHIRWWLGMATEACLCSLTYLILLLYAAVKVRLTAALSPRPQVCLLERLTPCSSKAEKNRLRTYHQSFSCSERLVIPTVSLLRTGIVSSCSSIESDLPCHISISKSSVFSTSQRTLHQQ